MTFEVVGIDFSPKMIDMARQLVPRGSFHIMDIEELDFPEESFHGAWANCSLLHIPKLKIANIFQKIHMILMPKGLFYLSVKQNQEGEVFEPDVRYNGLEKFWSFFQPDELEHLLVSAHFNIRDISITVPSLSYHTHPCIKVFAEKQTLI